MLAVFLLLFLARSLVTFPIEHVDAAFKYEAAANIVRGGGLDELLTNHHTMRWSEVLPQVLVTWATAFRYEGLYLLPLAAFALAGALLWRGLQPTLSLTQQALLLALLFLEPVGLTHTGQLLNPPFGVLYALLAITVLARPGPPSWRRTVLAALAFFCAYGAHSTYLSFAAGGVAWLLLFQRRPDQAAVLVLTLAGLLILETLAFNAIAADDLSGGRFEALAGSVHMESVTNRFDTVAFHELFTRWLDLPLFSLAMAIGFGICTLWLAFDGRARRAAPPFLILCILIGGAYAVAITFAIVSVDPLRPIQPLRVMYLEPFLPFAIAVTTYGAARLEDGVPRRLRPWLEGGAVSVLVVLVAFAATQKDQWDRIVNNRLNAFAWKSHEQMSAFAGRFRDGEIILQGRNRYAFEKLIRYSGPVKTRRTRWYPHVTSAPRIQRDVRCVRGIRRIPLERNERPCEAKVLEAAQTAGARWAD